MGTSLWSGAVTVAVSSPAKHVHKPCLYSALCDTDCISDYAPMSYACRGLYMPFAFARIFVFALFSISI